MKKKEDHGILNEPMGEQKKLSRNTRDLVRALLKHLTLLKKYSHSAFIDGEQDYYGEVAGKLRVLVYKSRTNTPLLLSLMEKFDVSIPILISHPGGDFETTIDEYLSMLAFAIRVPSRGLVEVSNRELIAIWAQQYGASHEDWEINEEFAHALSSGLNIGGIPAAGAALRAISNTVQWLGKQFLEIIKDIDISDE